MAPRWTRHVPGWKSGVGRSGDGTARGRARVRRTLSARAGVLVLALTAATVVTAVSQAPRASAAISCSDMLWIQGSAPQLGTVSSGGAWTPTFATDNPSTSLAVDLDGEIAYYTDNSTSTLHRIDLGTGTSTVLNTTPAAALMTNRLAYGPDGVLYSMPSGPETGHVWAIEVSDTEIVSMTDLGEVQFPSGAPVPNGSGDITFDGLGTLYLLDGAGNFYSLPADEQAPGLMNATYIGDISGTAMSGIAFGADGMLYATPGGQASTDLIRIDPATGSSVTLSSNGPSQVTDLASCAMPVPAVSATKSVSSAGPVHPGAQLTYTIDVANAGTLFASGATLSDAIPTGTTYVAGSTTLNGESVPDAAGTMPFASGSAVSSPGALTGVIEPGESATVTFAVTVDQPAAPGLVQVSNQAVVDHAGAPTGGIASDDPSTATPGDPTITSVVVPVSSLALTKTVSGVHDTNGNDWVDAGDRISYSFSVKNTGTVALAGLAVSDPRLQAAGLAVTCPTASLAPGATAVCTAPPYVITQADVDQGSVKNTATASATACTGTCGPVVSAPSSTSTRTKQVPSIEVVKKIASIRDVNSNGRVDHRDRVRFSFTATNTGSVTLTKVGIDDPMLASAGIEIVCARTTLAPGESTACRTRGTYGITRSDADQKVLRNLAAAYGSTPFGFGHVVYSNPGLAELKVRGGALVVGGGIASGTDSGVDTGLITSTGSGSTSTGSSTSGSGAGLPNAGADRELAGLLTLSWVLMAIGALLAVRRRGAI